MECSSWLIVIVMCGVGVAMAGEDPASPEKKAAPAANARKLKYAPGTKEQALAWQDRTRAELAGLLKIDDLLATGADIPLDAKTISSEDKGECAFREMEINSTANRRIALVLTRPKDGEGPFPAVLCIAGHGGTRHRCYERAHGYHGIGVALARGGYVTVSTEVSRHKVHEKGRTLIGERLWDLMRCVDLLESLDEVDPRRMGCAGKSLGGEMVMWLAGMDTRLRAAVCSGFLTVMDQMEHHHCMCWKVPGLRDLVDFADIYSLIAPRALHCQNGLREPKSQFPVPVAREALKEIEPIYRDLGAPENLGFVAHPGGHEFDLPGALGFLNKHLGGNARAGE